MADSFGSSTVAPPDQAAPPTQSGFQRIIGVLFNPVETFADIARRPDILVPLLVIVVISIVTSVVMVPRVDWEATIRDQMSQSGRDMAPEDEDRAVRFGVAAAKALAYASPVVGLIMLVIIAAILLFVFRLLGGEGTFKQAFSTTLYAWMPLLVSGIIGIIVLFAKGSVTAQQLPNLVMSNLSFLTSPRSNPVLYAFLSSIDLFSFWTLALFIIGFSYVARVTKAKSAAVVISLWLVLILAKIGFAAMSAMARAQS